MAPHIEKIAIAASEAEARARLAAGNSGAVRGLPAGTQIFVAYRAIGWAIGTRITTDWILDGETVDSAFKDIRNSEGENHLVSAGVGRGFRGGDWSVVIRAA